MFTKNYIEANKMQFMNRSTTITSTGGTSFTAYMLSWGSWLLNIGCWLDSPKVREIPTAQVSKSNSPPACGIYFGTGTTAATKDDYTLEAPITSGLSFSGATKTIGQISDGVYAAIGTFDVANTSGEDITISEIGVVTYVNSVNNVTTVYTGYPVLMERTVLEHPITIPVGESRLVTYTITFNQN